MGCLRGETFEVGGCVLALPQLLVSEVQKVLEDKLKDGTLFGLWESSVEVGLGKASHLRGGVEEGAKP